MSTTTAGTGYTGAVTWASSGGALDGYFAVTTAYTATITLTPTLTLWGSLVRSQYGPRRLGLVLRTILNLG